MNKKYTTRKRIHHRIRSRMHGTAERPRVVLKRSLRAVYAQAVNDADGTVVAQSSDLRAGYKGTPRERAKQVGNALGKALTDQKVTTVVFDRAGYQYHGRVQSVAEGLRESGINV